MMKEKNTQKNASTAMMRKRSRTDEDDNIGGDDKQMNTALTKKQ